MKAHEILTLIVFLFLSNPIIAQYRLSLSVADGNREALSGVTVVLYAKDTLRAGEISDAKGDVKFRDIPGDNYLMRVSMIGYKAYEQKLNVNRNITLPTIIIREDTSRLAEVTVTANRADLIQTTASSSVFHLSAQALKDSKDAFEALREVPKLIVDATNKTIQFADGSKPLVLVNGVNRPGYINSLDPADIESVEIISNPSARYRGEQSVTGIINLKVKRKKQTYTIGNFSTRHDPGLVYGVTNGSFEVGNSKSSLYMSGQQFYFNNDRIDTENRIRNGSFERNTSGDKKYDANMIYLHLGGDWIATDKDYWAFGIKFITNPSHQRIQESGTVVTGDAASNPIDIAQKLNNNYFTNEYNLYYKHSFTPNRFLELTGKFGLLGSGSNGWRDEKSDLYAYHSLIDMNNSKQSYSLEANYQFSLANKAVFNLGNNVYHQHVDIDDKADVYPSFKYKDTREYVYFDISRRGTHKFTYSASIGADMVFTDADRITNHYVNFVPTLSLSYAFKQDRSLSLSFSRNRISPGISQLNPRNTSTDSLQIITGNPYLKPYIDNRANLSYEWSRKGLYISPYVTYDYYTDMVEEQGRTEGRIYHSSYYNLGKHQILRAGVSYRITLANLGYVNMNVYYFKDFYKDYPFKGSSIRTNCNLFLQYKKVSLNLNEYYSGMSYNKNGKNKIMPQSEATFTWDLPKGWGLIAGMRYFLPKSEARSWTWSDNYESYSRDKYKDRNLMLLVGVSYNFRNKVKQAYRQKKRLNGTEEDLNIQLK